MIIFQKEYDGESIIDLPEDIGEMLDPDFNDLVDVEQIPQDEYGIHQGKFIVTVTWVPE